MIKTIKTDRYLIKFDTKKGIEMLTGINGHPDPFVLDEPNMIDIGVMGHCKNKCPMCYQGDKDEPNMKIEHYKMLIDQVKDVVNQVALGGRGDPNHHENFKEIMIHSYQKNIVPNFTTSGIELTDEQVEYSKIAGAVAVSDYQMPHTYIALKKLMDANIKTNIHTIFSEASADRCIEMIEGKDIWNGLVDLERLNAVVFLLFKPQGKGKALTSWIPSVDQIRRFSDAIKDPKCKFKVGMDSCMVNRLKTTGTIFSKIEEMMLDTCEAGRMSSYVAPNMKFMPCSFCDHDKEGISLLEKPLKEIWQTGHSFLSVREKLTKNPKGCPYTL